MASLLRVAVVQFAPKLGEVHANIAKARELCRGLTPRSVDLVCFPEMIFSGYMFPDAPSIAPYLEHPQTGPTATFCAELARHLQCHVVAGYPERLELPAQSSIPSESNPAPSSVAPTTPEPGPKSESNGASLPGANAALLVDTTGHPLHTYHKSNLFRTDLTWARPGPGFTTLDLPDPFGRTALAICNDINVSNTGTWQSIEWGPYELAGFCRKERVRVLVLLNAWLRPEDGGMEGVEEGGGDGDRDCDRIVGADAGTGRANDDTPEQDSDGEELEPNWQVLNYWAMRLRPLWAKDVHGDSDTNAEGSEGVRQRSETARSKEEQDLVVVVCNRFGRERGKVFAGSSAMFSMRRGSGKPRLLHAMGEREEGVCVWTVRLGSHTLA